jgi:hypothetical protein
MIYFARPTTGDDMERVLGDELPVAKAAAVTD